MNNEQLEINNYQLGMRTVSKRSGSAKAKSINNKIAHCSLLIFNYLLLFSFLILFGCWNPLSPSQQQIPPGLGAFSLSIDGARTILPNTTITSFQVYTLEFTGTEILSIDRTNANLSTPINLQVGTYNLTVTAYMDTEKTKPAAVGSLTDIVITAGQVTNRTIPLTAFGMTAGKGAFCWNIDFPDGLNEVKMKITPVDRLTGTSEQTLYFKGGSSQVNKIDSVDLNSGMYRVLFTLIKNENTQTVIWRDVVHVYQNMTSVFNYTFTEEHFNNIRYTVTFVYNNGTTGDSPVDCLHGKAVNAPASPSRTGYIFDGWYTDNGNFHNKYDFSTVLTGDLKLYAKWNPISYKIVYDKGELGATGTTADSIHTYDEPKPLTANGYSYTGYTFAGWARTEGGTVEFRDDGHNVVNLTSENNATITLYALWGTQPYYIEYNKNSNEATETMKRSTFYFGIKEYLEENAFTNTGYTFEGWARTSGGSVEFADKQAVLDLASSAGATVTLYAKWTVHKLAFNYNGGGGTGTAPNSPTLADYGTNVTMPDNTYKYTGYTFAGWEVSGIGSIEETYSARESVAVKDLSTAIKTGNASITLTAKWTANTLSISYDNGGGSGSAPTEPASAAYGTSVTMPVNPYTRTGYTFTGWVVSGTGSVPGTHVAGASIAVSALSTTIANGDANITLTAKWEINQYTITYYPDGGTPAPSSPVKMNYNTVIDHPPTMTKTGYTFDNWYTDSNKTIVVAFPITVTGDVSLYAKWTAHILSISYANGGGTGNAPTSPASADYGTSITMPANPFTYTGHTFAGWVVSGTGSVTGTHNAVESVAVSALSTSINTGNASITLTASWTANTLTISYANGGGTGTAPTNPITAAYGTDVIMPNNTFTHIGYMFAGWEVSGTGSVAKTYAAEESVAVSALSTSINTGNASIMLTAKWTIDMVYVPGGSFQMGGNIGNVDEQLVHTVTLSGFYMGKYEVTQEQWTAVMGNNPSSFTSSPASGEVQNKRPVESVSWYDALVFCNKLSMMEGLSPAYRISGSTDPANWGNVPTSSDSTWNAVQIVAGSTGYRLPTEAQWEYAAKGGNGSPGNYTYSGSDTAGDVAWYYDNSGSKTHEVGKKAPNDLGLYDMSGNVWEWCWDWYGTYVSGAQTNPEGADSGSDRVLRGGSWYLSAELTRSAYRRGDVPYGRGDVNGFRLVRP